MFPTSIFRIIPIGSYTTNAKIIDIDEFDFVLLTEPKTRKLGKKTLLKILLIYTDMLNDHRDEILSKPLPTDPHIVGV